MLDRAVQKEILTMLRSVYPAGTSLTFDTKDEEKQWIYNIAYLSELGLVEANIRYFLDDEPPLLGGCKITAAGLDFLEDDGGLSAILGVVTVRLHADTVKELLIAKVNASKEPETVKASMVKAIRNMPAEATKLASVKLMEAGAAHMPDMLGWLRTMTGL